MSIVALFVDPTKDEVSEVLDSGLIDLIQFHGNESEEFCSSFDTPYMKALHIKDQFLPLSVFDKYSSARYLLLTLSAEKCQGEQVKPLTGQLLEMPLRKLTRDYYRGRIKLDKC